MQLVGAPIAYIRGPFVVEGLIQGGIGAVVALVVLWITFFVVRSRADAWLAGAIDPAALVFLVDFRSRHCCWPPAWRSERSADSSPRSAREGNRRLSRGCG